MRTDFSASPTVAYEESQMTQKFTLGATVVVAVSLSTTAFAGASDYVFEPMSTQVKKGDDVIVSVRLKHKPTGKVVRDAVIVQTRIDMAPEGMAEMSAPLTAVPSTEPGVYSFRTDLSMQGQWLLSIAAKVQDEPETVVGKITLQASR
jgi:YtkA-like